MTPDQPITMALAILGAILSIALPSRYALIPLVLSMFLYPSTINIPPDTMQFNLSRVIVIVLLARCLIATSIRAKFKWGWADTGAMLYFGATSLSALLNAKNSGEAVNNRLGFFLSAIAPYFCARLLVTDRARLYGLFKVMLWCAAGLALEGLTEMLTGENPYAELVRFSPVWQTYGGFAMNTRLFLGAMYTRATGPFVQCIMFGWFFALLMAPMTNLFFEKKSLTPWAGAWLALPVGIITSIAAGPMSMAVVSLVLTGLFPLRRFWKVGVACVLVAWMGIAIGSNRTPMEIAANMGFDQSSAWFRVGLLRYTLDQGGMTGHWFAGYGLVPPEYAHHHDLCIHWVALAVIHGLLGVIGFHAFVAAVCWPLWVARRKAVSIADQWLLWSFMSTVVASILALQLVSLFSEMYHIYLMFLGIVANARFFIGQSTRQMSIMAQRSGLPVLLRYTLQPGQKLALVSRPGPSQPPAAPPPIEPLEDRQA